MTQRGDPKSRSTGRAGDDLRKIEGVGPRFEQRLWDAGIFTYKDLARRTPEEIAAVLAPMAGISPERIARQARELAGLPPEESEPRQHYAAFHVEFLLESDNRVRRTKVRHHQTDVRDAWAGWDEEKLLAFLRAHIPLPATGTPADAPGPEPGHTQTADQAPARVPARPASRPSPSGPKRPPSLSLSIEELAPVRGGQHSYTRGPGERNPVRLTMRIDPAGPLSEETFDFSAIIAARTFGGRGRSPLGTTQGTIRVSDPVSVEVVGPALPLGHYRLVATVEIYTAGHSSEEPPLYSQGVSGDLMWVADPAAGSASVVA
jgi:Helix-hairpin-helix domain